MHNFEPDRWPCGNPGTFRDTDGSPTKTYVRNRGEGSMEYEANFGKRPQEELYNLEKDPESMNNLADDPEYAALRNKMKAELFSALKAQKDPRMFGKGHLFDEYEYYHPPHKLKKMKEQELRKQREREAAKKAKQRSN